MPNDAIPVAGVTTLANTLVVLIAPELLGGEAAAAALRTTFAAAPPRVRILVRVTDAAGLGVLQALAELGVPMQVLLAPDVPPPHVPAAVVAMPSGSTPEQVNELALILSDVIVAGEPAPPASPLLARAADMHKAILVPGAPLPALAAGRPGVAEGLDPQTPSWWRAPVRGFSGRIEQGLLELLAFDWPRNPANGPGNSRARLRKCVRGAWMLAAYFAPLGWEALDPDRVAVDASAPIVARFEVLDRSALHGSYIHRDLIWVTHLAAAAAVLFAVAGEVHHRQTGGGEVWGVLELVGLFLIAFLIDAARRRRLQERWTACRLAAEQLRIARTCLPLLVVPPALAAVDRMRPPRSEAAEEICLARMGARALRVAGRPLQVLEAPAAPPHPRRAAADLTARALAEVQRAVRDQGLPRLGAGGVGDVRAAAEWLLLIVADQIGYHDDNHRKLEHAERRLRCLTTFFFALAILAVIAHLIAGHSVWLLLLTAAGPAFAAALHGAGTRLGIVHRVALSRDSVEGLGPIADALRSLLADLPPSQTAWPRLRALALDAAEAMGRENTSWHGLVRRERDTLPA